MTLKTFHFAGVASMSILYLTLLSTMLIINVLSNALLENPRIGLMMKAWDLRVCSSLNLSGSNPSNANNSCVGPVYTGFYLTITGSPTNSVIGPPRSICL